MSHESPPGEHGFFRRNSGKFVLSAIITTLLLVTLSKGGMPLVPKATDFEHTRWWTVGAYFLTLPMWGYFRAVRWRFLLRGFRPIPLIKILNVSWIGFAAIMLFPFRLGEFVRPLLLREKDDRDPNMVPSLVPGLPPRLSLTAATGTVVAERVIDGLYLSLVLAAALLLAPTVSPLPERVPGLPKAISVENVRHLGFVMLGIFSAALVVIAVYYFGRSFARRITLAVVGVVSKKLANFLANTAEKLADGLRAFSNPRDILGFLFETSLYWIPNALGMWLLAWGTGIVHADGSAITFLEACALMGMLGITILLPGPPGLLGVFQAGIFAGLASYFPEHIILREGAAYVFLMYTCQLVWSVLSAAICLRANQSAMASIRAEMAEPPH